MMSRRRARRASSRPTRGASPTSRSETSASGPLATPVANAVRDVVADDRASSRRGMTSRRFRSPRRRTCADDQGRLAGHRAERTRRRRPPRRDEVAPPLPGDHSPIGRSEPVGIRHLLAGDDRRMPLSPCRHARRRSHDVDRRAVLPEISRRSARRRQGRAPDTGDDGRAWGPPSGTARAPMFLAVKRASARLRCR